MVPDLFWITWLRGQEPWLQRRVRVRPYKSKARCPVQSPMSDKIGICQGLLDVDEVLCATFVVQVCNIAVGVVNDLASAMGEAIVPYCDDIMRTLLENLRALELNRDVKPVIIACFGDIALNIGSKFEKYLPVVMNVMDQASKTKVCPVVCHQSGLHKSQICHHFHAVHECITLSLFETMLCPICSFCFSCGAPVIGSVWGEQRGMARNFMLHVLRKHQTRMKTVCGVCVGVLVQQCGWMVP